MQDGASRTMAAGSPAPSFWTALKLECLSRTCFLISSFRPHGWRISSEDVDLTPLGAAATGGDEVSRDEARRKAVMHIEPYRAFLTAFNGKRVPSPVVFREFLVKSAGVAAERAAECADMIVADARFAKLLRPLKGVDFVTGRGGFGPSNVAATTGTNVLLGRGSCERLRVDGGARFKMRLRDRTVPSDLALQSRLKLDGVVRRGLYRARKEPDPLDTAERDAR